jgi:hypothetical protein
MIKIAMKESSHITKYMDKVFICTLMADITKAHGLQTRCMALVSSIGQMVNPIKENTQVIRSMALGYLLGQMVDNTKVCGTMDYSMERECILIQKE